MPRLTTTSAPLKLRDSVLLWLIPDKPVHSVSPLPSSMFQEIATLSGLEPALPVSITVKSEAKRIGSQRWNFGCLQSARVHCVRKLFLWGSELEEHWSSHLLDRAVLRLGRLSRQTTSHDMMDSKRYGFQDATFVSSSSESKVLITLSLSSLSQAQSIDHYPVNYQQDINSYHW